MFQTKFVEEIKAYILCSTAIFSEVRAVYDIMCKNIYSRTDYRRQYGACALHAAI